VVLKEKQTGQKKTLQVQNAVFMPYEQWLRNHGLSEEAEKRQHHKNKQILLWKCRMTQQAYGTIIL
jgi:hypothetical protein